jgi:hypothetical protein
MSSVMSEDPEEVPSEHGKVQEPAGCAHHGAVGVKHPFILLDRSAHHLDEVRRRKFLGASSNQRLHAFSLKVPAIAPVSRAALSDDAPAVGAAILPFSDQLLPTRAALMKVSS